MKTCPICGQPVHKVIFAGFPMLLCQDHDCSCLYGFWSWIGELAIEAGAPPAFIAYDGSYWTALWTWLTEPIHQEDHEDWES